MKLSKFLTEKRSGIRLKLFGYMMLFLVLLLILLWLFQVVFFGEIYKSVRIWEIKNSTRLLSDGVDLEEQILTDIAEEISKDKQACVMIFDEYGNIIVNCDTISNCIIHQMPASTIYMMYEFAEESGGERLTRFNLDSFNNLKYAIDNNPYSPDEGNHDETESIIYTKIVTSESRRRKVTVMLNTTISPVTSTVRTLQSGLALITVTMTLAAAVISFFMARRVSKPIIAINKSAKELAAGNYNAEFTSDGYREIAELANTMAFAAAELSKAGTLQKELIANISHDLRTPLTMIKGYAEMMRDLPEENSAENFGVIIGEAERLSSLVNDVLDISKLQSGVQELNLSEFNLTEAIVEVIERFSHIPYAKEREIRFLHTCDAVVIADRTRILQVIYNYISNALNHSDDDKAVVVIQRILDGEAGIKRVRVEVRDEGDGISPEDIDKIWGRYYKVDKHHRRSQIGSGLGLSIIKGILELHSAKYGVESEVGHGSVFWFEL